VVSEERTGVANDTQHELVTGEEMTGASNDTQHELVKEVVEARAARDDQPEPVNEGGARALGNVQCTIGCTGRVRAQHSYVILTLKR
jgi:hypothetical protein